MIPHPVLLGVKLILLVITVAILAALYGVLTPQQFLVATVIAVVAFLGLGTVLAVVFLKLMARPGSRLGRGMIHTLEARAEDGYVGVGEDFSSMVGERGVALTALRPSGRARFGQKRVPVVTEGEYIARGAEVEIISVTGARVVVHTPPAPPEPRQPGSPR